MACRLVPLLIGCRGAHGKLKAGDPTSQVPCNVSRPAGPTPPQQDRLKTRPNRTQSPDLYQRHSGKSINTKHTKEAEQQAQRDRRRQPSCPFVFLLLSCLSCVSGYEFFPTASDIRPWCRLEARMQERVVFLFRWFERPVRLPFAIKQGDCIVARGTTISFLLIIRPRRRSDVRGGSFSSSMPIPSAFCRFRRCWRVAVRADADPADRRRRRRATGRPRGEYASGCGRC